MELLAKLGIDWKLLIAQIVNFSVLIGVLGFFVYKPLLNLLDARSERIRKAMEEARRLEDQAKEMEAIRTQQLKKIDQECGALLERTKQHAEKLKEEILATAKRESEQMIIRSKQQAIDERAKLLADAQKVLSAMIVRMTEKIIEREFSPADQQRLTASIAKELPSLLS